MPTSTIISQLRATPEAIASAVAILRGGGLVAFPTETVYGLGADACSDLAVARIFAAKERPRFNPLIAHVASADDAFALVEANASARLLAARFWPGALTLLLRRRPGCPVSLLATAGLDTLAVRVPAGRVASALLAQAGPIAAPSANRAGCLSPTTAADVATGLGDRVDLILDDGPCAVGIESTIVDLTNAERPVLLRPGGIPRDQIEAVVGALATHGPPHAAPTAPGQLASHYAPSRPLRTNAATRRPGEAYLGFGTECAGADANLSPAGDTTEAAARLFALLRTLDRPPFSAIAVAPIPESGLGEAINDRLRRAAAPRDGGWGLRCGS